MNRRGSCYCWIAHIVELSFLLANLFSGSETQEEPYSQHGDRAGEGRVWPVRCRCLSQGGGPREPLILAYWQIHISYSGKSSDRICHCMTGLSSSVAAPLRETQYTAEEFNFFLIRGAAFYRSKDCSKPMKVHSCRVRSRCLSGRVRGKTSRICTDLDIYWLFFD